MFVFQVFVKLEMIDGATVDALGGLEEVGLGDPRIGNKRGTYTRKVSDEQVRAQLTTAPTPPVLVKVADPDSCPQPPTA